MKKILLFIFVITLLSCSEDNDIFEYSEFELGIWDMQERHSREMSFGEEFDDFIIKIYDDSGNEVSYSDGGMVEKVGQTIIFTLKDESIFKSSEFTGSGNRGYIYLVRW